MSKVVGPTTTLTFLGIQLNTVTKGTSITSKKKLDLFHELHWMTHRDSCAKKELLSLIGKLSFCCKVLSAGRMFLRRMINLSTTVKKLNHHILLTTEAQLDIQWWINYLPKWSGKSLILKNEWTPSPTLHLCMDASGSHGHTGQGDGCKLAGRLPSSRWTSPGKNYLPWYLLYTHGAHSGRVVKFYFTVTINQLWISGTRGQFALHKL